MNRALVGPDMIELCHIGKANSTCRYFELKSKRCWRGELYHANDAELEADRSNASAWMVRYNAALTTSDADRRALLRELLAEAGDGAVIRPPFYCDYGYNIRIGPDVFFNFNCVVLDVVAVTVGARTQIGPAV